MFVSFLYPFRLRGRVAPYLWIAYKQMTDLPPDDVCFIGAADYFIDPSEFTKLNRFECSWPENEELGFRVPEYANVRAYDAYFVPDRIYRRLKRTLIADSLVWLHLMQHVDEELVAFVLECLEKIARTASVDALLTWCNFASLSEAGRRAGIPVIHNELGPLRFPWYKPLGYFDFSGVNGNTEAERRFRAWRHTEPVSGSFNRHRLLALFSGESDVAADTEPEFELGIPLQVEDDSNVLAYGRGFDLPLVLQYALETHGTDTILVRPHPGAYLVSSAKGMRVDDSPTAASFVQRCRRILTLNSSIAIEAMLAGRPATILGESPARFVAGTTVGDARMATDDELDFLLLNYFVPYRLIFDATYYRWRLTSPTEEDIRERHLAELQ